jgi:hypothetical protein
VELIIGWSALSPEWRDLKNLYTFGFLSRWMQRAHGACEGRAQKTKWYSQKVSLIHSYTCYRVKILIVQTIQVKQEQQQWNPGFFAQFWHKEPRR